MLRSGSRQTTLDTARRLAEGAADVDAITAVVTALADVTSSAGAVDIALQVVRERFDWAYGSYWHIDRGHRPTSSSPRSRVTPAASSAGRPWPRSFGMGEGLSGRTWKTRELVFVSDLGDMPTASGHLSPSAPGCTAASASRCSPAGR